MVSIPSQVITVPNKAVPATLYSVFTSNVLDFDAMRFSVSLHPFFYLYDLTVSGISYRVDIVLTDSGSCFVYFFHRALVSALSTPIGFRQVLPLSRWALSPPELPLYLFSASAAVIFYACVGREFRTVNLHRLSWPSRHQAERGIWHPYQAEILFFCIFCIFVCFSRSVLAVTSPSSYSQPENASLENKSRKKHVNKQKRVALLHLINVFLKSYSMLLCRLFSPPTVPCSIFRLRFSVLQKFFFCAMNARSASSFLSAQQDRAQFSFLFYTQ